MLYSTSTVKHKPKKGEKMKSLIILAVAILPSAIVLAGGGGVASNSCGRSYVKTITTCKSATLTLEIANYVTDNFAESGRKCEDGGRKIKVANLELRTEKLGLGDQISRPSTQGLLNSQQQFEGPFSRGGLVVNEMKFVNKKTILVDTTVSVGWGGVWEAVNGRNFTENLICK